MSSIASQTIYIYVFPSALASPRSGAVCMYADHDRSKHCIGFQEQSRSMVRSSQLLRLGVICNPLHSRWQAVGISKHGHGNADGGDSHAGGPIFMLNLCY